MFIRIKVTRGCSASNKELSVTCRVIAKEYVPWTPALHDTSKQRLFWIVSNVGAKPVYHLPEMAICKTDNLWCCHTRFQCFENLCK